MFRLCWISGWAGCSLSLSTCFLLCPLFFGSCPPTTRVAASTVFSDAFSSLSLFARFDPHLSRDFISVCAWVCVCNRVGSRVRHPRNRLNTLLRIRYASLFRSVERIRAGKRCTVPPSCNGSYVKGVQHGFKRLLNFFLVFSFVSLNL